MVMIGRPPASERARLMFWQCRTQGATVVEAECAAEVTASTARRWIIDSGGVRPRRSRPRSARFLSLEYREQIDVMVRDRCSIAAIAAALGRHRTTISREIERGTNRRGYYVASTAHRAAQARSRRPKPAKLAVHDRLRAFVEKQLTKKFSPEQISRTLVRRFPNDPEMRQYFPKGTGLSVRSEEHLRLVADKLDDRPRRTHYWRTPAENLNELFDVQPPHETAGSLSTAAGLYSRQGRKPIFGY